MHVSTLRSGLRDVLCNTPDDHAHVQFAMWGVRGTNYVIAQWANSHPLPKPSWETTRRGGGGGNMGQVALQKKRLQPCSCTVGIQTAGAGSYRDLLIV